MLGGRGQLRMEEYSIALLPKYNCAQFWTNLHGWVLSCRMSLVLPRISDSLHMNYEEFSLALPEFNRLLVEYLAAPCNFQLINNYVKETSVSDFSLTSVKLGHDTVTFTISYDRLYQVPVFHVTYNGGLEAPKEHGKYLCVEFHHVLQTPYLMLHPCETAETMKSVDLSGAQYLVSWFGLEVGRASFFELRVPSGEYLKSENRHG